MTSADRPLDNHVVYNLATGKRLRSLIRKWFQKDIATFTGLQNLVLHYSRVRNGTAWHQFCSENHMLRGQVRNMSAQPDLIIHFRMTIF